MSGMIRVTPGNKCPICGHDTWCVIGHSVIICMRTHSPKEVKYKGGEVGYVHPHPDPQKKRTFAPVTPRRPPTINARRVLQDWHRAYEREQSRLPIMASALGVTIDSLKALECQAAGGWERAWGFPMKDGYGNYIGIRLRNEWGKKWAVLGSQAGIFIPNVPFQNRMFIVEGPTDTAAAVSLGLFAIGRPSCSGGVVHIQHLLQCHRVGREIVRQVVIVSDNDDPGIRGAQDLQKWLPVPSCLLLLPCKDIREFIKFGDKSTIDSMIEQVVWTQPTKDNEHD